jgi:hypothetical protein
VGVVSVKICGYCKERVDVSMAQRVDFALNGNRTKIAIWFCSLHCVFWGGAAHARSGFATTVKALRERFGAAVEVVK